MKKPLVSIITVTYNSEEYIGRLLSSLKKTNYSPLEIIIWDNLSTDKTVNIASEYKGRNIRIYSSKINYGYAEGNNKALKKAKGEYILLINPDTVVRPDFLVSLVERAESSEKIAAVQPLVFLMKDKRKINLTGKETQFLGFDWIRDYKKKTPRKAGEISSFSGSGVLLKKDILKKTKFFDPLYFMYQEDTDLSWRLRLFGYKIYFEPKSIIYHDYKYVPKESYHPLKNKLKYYERNRLATIFKNYETRTLLLLLPAIVFVEMAMIVFSAKEGWLREKLSGYYYLFKNFNSFLTQREFVQKKRKVDDKKITEIFKSGLLFGEFQIPPVRNVVNPILSLYWKVIRRFI